MEVRGEVHTRMFWKQEVHYEEGQKLLDDDLHSERKREQMLLEPSRQGFAVFKP